MLEDAYLQGTTRFNTSDLRVESGKRISYLKFVVPAITENITTAKLVLNVSTDSGNGVIEIFKGSSNTWTENNLSTTNKPNEGTKIGTLNTNYNIGQSYEWTLSGITSGETVTLIIKQTGGNDVSFSAKEGANTPKLVLDVVCNTNNRSSSQSDAMISIFPNPIEDNATISGLKVGDEVVVYDFSGNEKMRITAKSEKETVEFSSLREGFYFVSINGTKATQIIKK